MSRLNTFLRAFRELGPRQLGFYALYRLGLESGHYRRALPARENIPAQSLGLFRPILVSLPGQEELLACMEAKDAQAALQEAEEISSGLVRLFGSEPVPLDLAPPGPLQHWTVYERGREPWGTEDVKFIWEPARFGWAFRLARAYRLTGNESFAEAFWRAFETFTTANPPDMGPNWASGQEVALRLISLAFAGQVFGEAQASSEERRERLKQTIAAHADRIPPTLVYARSQHNNHLLSEAAGLLTAAACLPEYPRANRWKAAGWRWLNAGFQAQIAPNGAYAQHSANYHRLALHLALWSDAAARRLRLEWPAATQKKLAAATRWLLELSDPLTGRVPNLGPNDGAHLLPLSSCRFDDYRPVLQAAARVFLGESAFPPGPWDELAGWLEVEERPGSGTTITKTASELEAGGPDVLCGPNSWAYLRAAEFTSRPGHADQLHLDLWWRGQNVALDAGTYRYSAPPPWENSLARSAVHNTLSLEGMDQMQRVGKFLFLNWAQAQVREHSRTPEFETLTARVDSPYLGLIHERQVERQRDEWRVSDRLLPRNSTHPVSLNRQAVLHWLLPDWTWQMDVEERQVLLRLKSPLGTAQIIVRPDSESGFLWAVRLVRAGELLHQAGAYAGSVDPTLGWTSPTYNHKLPVLSLSVQAPSSPGLRFLTIFRFPD